MERDYDVSCITNMQGLNSVQADWHIYTCSLLGLVVRTVPRWQFGVAHTLYHSIKMHCNGRLSMHVSPCRMTKFKRDLQSHGAFAGNGFRLWACINTYTYQCRSRHRHIRLYLCADKLVFPIVQSLLSI